MSIGTAVDFMSNSYTDLEEIAEVTSRKYGCSACDVLVERESKLEAMEHLQNILDVLSDTQKAVLLTKGAGYTQEVAAEIIGITQPSYNEALAGIPTRLNKIADEERIQFLADEITRLVMTSRGRHSDLYADLCKELDQRYKVRQSMKQLLVLLTPPESTKEMTGRVSLPAYTFERLMEVNLGMREGIEEGRKVMKTRTKCLLPEYFSDVFNDKYTCCTLCAQCARKKDIYGRKGYGKYGYETVHEDGSPLNC